MTPVTVAVLGPADAGVADLAARVDTAGRPDLRAFAHLPADTRPDVALLALDPVCPARPDDVSVALGVASRVPLVVVLVSDPRHPADSQVRSRSADRLTAAGLPAPLVLVPDGGVSGDDDVDPPALLDLLRCAAGTPPPRSAPAPPPNTAAAETLDWLSARRAEAITARSAALRQDVQAVRMEFVSELHRCIREAGHDARDAVDRGHSRSIPGIVSSLESEVDGQVARIFTESDDAIDRLLARHLGPGNPQVIAAAAPASGIVMSTPPRHRTEETLTLAMGAAGGTGVGRMLLAPLADSPDIGALVIPLAVAGGLALGAATVRIRRTQTARAHIIASITERLAGLRSEAEQSLGGRLLAAESVITDGFAHDPGPRVADLDRRIRALRRRVSPERAVPTPGDGRAPSGTALVRGGATWMTA